MGLNSFCFLKNNGTAAQTIVAAETKHQQFDQDLSNMKVTFRTIMEVISAVGVVGNVLNLITLRSPSLQTVPFVFIRALALFDLISLAAIFLHFMLETFAIDSILITYYYVWVEDVLINAFLVAGLYCAVLLTVERYMLIRKPFKKYRLSVEYTVLLKIVIALLFSIVIHIPQALQNTVKKDPITGRLVKGNNDQFICREPFWTLFNYYKMTRELIRFFSVLILILLNVIIAKHLQIAKKNRRMLIKRTSYAGIKEESQTQPQNAALNGEKNKERRDQTLFKSFTEKKLTALMAAICIIYAIGNLPQMAVMVLQNEAMNSQYKFQVFRQIANTCEVLNHSLDIKNVLFLNFFLFSIASSEYMRAFLSLRPIRYFLIGIPFCASFINAQKRLSCLEEAISQGGGFIPRSQPGRNDSTVKFEDLASNNNTSTNMTTIPLLSSSDETPSYLAASGSSSTLQILTTQNNVRKTTQSSNVDVLL